MHKRISGVVIVLIGLLGITGCGDASSISKSDYKQQVELVCNKGLKEREELLKKVTPEYVRRSRNATAKERVEEQEQNVRKLMTVYQGTTEELVDIGLPDEGEKTAEELVKAREDGASKLKADPRLIGEFTAIFAKASKSAEDLGVSSCGK